MRTAGQIVTADLVHDRIAALQSRPAGRQARIERLELYGTTLWLKRPERRKSLRWRLQKGDPRRALANDIAGLHFLAEHDVPAPKILASGADFLVTEDAGQPLDRILAEGERSDSAELTAAAARTLAALHRAGARHGRPKLRDICWDGNKARLIDLERFAAPVTARAMGLDWAILLHSILEIRPDDGAAVTSAVETYRNEAPQAAVDAGTRLVRRLGWIAPLVRLALRIWPDQRELTAVARLPAAFEETCARRPPSIRAQRGPASRSTDRDG